MKVLVAHNHYLLEGGEDQVYRNEIDLLQSNGVTVHSTSFDNESILSTNKVIIGLNTIWSVDSYRQISNLIRKVKPDLAHFHNTFPLLSPSVYYACHSQNVPVVQTLHNYRLLCPSALFLRNGQICEECVGKVFAWPGIRHKCYHNSHLATFSVAAMQACHRVVSTWQKQVDCYISMTEFMKKKLITGGIPSEKIAVKPNFVFPDPGGKQSIGDYAIFVGRLSAEKGTNILLDAWRNCSVIPLKVVGGGPELKKIQTYLLEQGLHEVELKGQVERSDVYSMMKNARFLLVPSVCYESFPLTIVEAFSNGLPVIASRLGAMVEIIEDGVTGILFSPGDTNDLTRKIKWAWHNPDRMREMGNNARQEFERKYTAKHNLNMLTDIYQKVISNKLARSQNKLRLRVR